MNRVEDFLQLHNLSNASSKEILAEMNRRRLAHRKASIGEIHINNSKANEILRKSVAILNEENDEERTRTAPKMISSKKLEGQKYDLAPGIYGAVSYYLGYNTKTEIKDRKSTEKDKWGHVGEVG